jgi:hypothetical protein
MAWEFEVYFTKWYLNWLSAVLTSDLLVTKSTGPSWSSPCPRTQWPVISLIFSCSLPWPLGFLPGYSCVTLPSSLGLSSFRLLLLKFLLVSSHGALKQKVCNQPLIFLLSLGDLTYAHSQLLMYLVFI